MREAQEWDAIALDVERLGMLADFKHPDYSRDSEACNIARARSERAAGLCRANAEEWRARARRCPR
jgi:hypothetical protein